MSRFSTFLAILTMLFLMIPPTSALAGGGCGLTMEKIGTELIVTSSTGINQITFGQVSNLNVNILGGRESAFVWDLSTNPTQVRWNSYVKEQSFPGLLDFTVSQTGCEDPILISVAFSPTYRQADMNNVFRIPEEACATASVQQSISWDANANIYLVTLTASPGTKITQLSSIWLTNGGLTVFDYMSMPSPRGNQPAQFDLFIKHEQTLEMRVEATTGDKPIFRYAVNTTCGGWSASL